MLRFGQGFAVILVLVSLILGGCSQKQQVINELKLENQKLRSEVTALWHITKEQHAQIEQAKKRYELRNTLDIKARSIISALNKGVFGEAEQALLSENVDIQTDRLVFFLDGHTNEILFFENRLDYKRVRQRYYELDEENRFITGYEVALLPGNLSGGEDKRGVLVFIFEEKANEWKLANIEADR